MCYYVFLGSELQTPKPYTNMAYYEDRSELYETLNSFKTAYIKKNSVTPKYKL